MAQKTGNEETEVKVPETITLCVNNCGVVGNPATKNMCQKCFAATTSTVTATAISTTTSSSSSNMVTGSSTLPMKFSREKSYRSTPDRLTESSSLIRQHPTMDRAESGESTAPEAKRVVNRCSGCRRKVGLIGFRCRCGELFCSEHRYSDRHDCSYDYKAAGREAIVRENPVVKAAKIVRV